MYRKLDKLLARMQVMPAMQSVYRQQKLRFLRDLLSVLEGGSSMLDAFAAARVAENVGELRFELIDRWLDPSDPRCLTGGPSLADAYRYPWAPGYATNSSSVIAKRSLA